MKNVYEISFKNGTVVSVTGDNMTFVHAELEAQEKLKKDEKLLGISGIALVDEIRVRPKCTNELRNVEEMQPVLKVFKEMHDDIEAGDYTAGENDKNAAFEAVAVALFGEEYFEWYNQEVK